jgi:tetratricopeptide (TPR) repeat protein
LYATKDYKTMVKVGDEMIKSDTSFSDTTYFDRTLDAYRQDSSWAKAAEVASQATKKYPHRADYWAQRGQLELKSGQTQQAVSSFKRALDIDPKTPGARLLIITSLLDANQYDSAMFAIREAKAFGEDANTLGGMAITVGTHYFRMLNDTAHKELKTIPNLQRLQTYVLYGDSLTTDRAAKNNAKFLMGISHYFIATLMIGDIQAQKNCEGAKQLQDILISASSELPVGGAISPETVKQLMPVVAQLAGTADQMIKVYCAPPKKP